MKALSIWQPWAWLIVRPDIKDKMDRSALRSAGAFKDIENRDWPTSIRGWVLVQASKHRLSRADWASAAAFAGKQSVEVPPHLACDTGALVGAMRIDDCVTRAASPWFLGRYGFRIGSSVAFTRPLPCVGLQGFFPVPLTPELIAELELAQIAAACGLPSAPERTAYAHPSLAERMRASTPGAQVIETGRIPQ